MSEINKRKIKNFKNNKRGLLSLYILLIILIITLPAEFIANDKPLLINYDGKIYLPIFKDYVETTFGGDFETNTDYKDPYVIELIENKGWMIWPIIPFSYQTVNYNLDLGMIWNHQADFLSINNLEV